MNVKNKDRWYVRVIMYIVKPISNLLDRFHFAMVPIFKTDSKGNITKLKHRLRRVDNQTYSEMETIKEQILNNAIIDILRSAKASNRAFYAWILDHTRPLQEEKIAVAMNFLFNSSNQDE